MKTDSQELTKEYIKEESKRIWDWIEKNIQKHEELFWIAYQNQKGQTEFIGFDVLFTSQEND